MHALQAKWDTERKSVFVEWWAVQDIGLGPLGESHAIIVQRGLSIIQYDTQGGTPVKIELKRVCSNEVYAHRVLVTQKDIVNVF